MARRTKPFDDSQQKDRRKSRSNPSTSTSGYDAFRQGIELTLPKHYVNSIVKIHSGHSEQAGNHEVSTLILGHGRPRFRDENSFSEGVKLDALSRMDNDGGSSTTTIIISPPPPPPPPPPPTFNPLSVTGCQVWYDASYSGGGVGGGSITALPDQSGNGRNATVSGALVRTMVNAGYNNGPTINRTDATDQIVFPILGLTTNPFTIVFVGDAPAAAYNYIIKISPTDFRAQAGKFRATGKGGLTLLDFSATTTSPSVVVIVYDGANSRVYVSALTPVIGTVGTQPNLTGAAGYLGDAAGGGGGDLNFRHCLVYDGAKSSVDIAYLINGFGAESAITIGA